MTKSRQVNPTAGRGASPRPSANGRPSSVKLAKKSATKKGTSSLRKRSRTISTGYGELPGWAQKTLAGMSIAVILVAAYFLVIRQNSFRWKPCYGNRDFEVCVPLVSGVFGIDVSHHQGYIEWNKVKEASSAHPIRFAIIKATEGGDFKDENFDYNWTAALDAGLARGAYLFYNPDTSPEIQAEFFISNVMLGQGDLPPVVDIELRGPSVKKMNEDLAVCLDMLESHYGVKPVIYTSYKFFKHCLGNGRFDSYPLWLAHYNVETPETDADWTFWQFSSHGRLDGIRENVDLNVFRGDWKSFEKFKL